MTVALVKDGVSIYSLNTRTFVRQDSRQTAEHHMVCARELGDTLTEYETTDRDGNPLRVVLQIEHDLDEWCDFYSVDATGERYDAGAVWEFTSPRRDVAPDLAVALAS